MKIREGGSASWAPGLIKVWICGRLCAVFGYTECDYSVGIWPHFVIEHIIVLEGVEFEVHEHERLYEDHLLENAVMRAALETAQQIERLQIPDYNFNDQER